MPKPDNYNGTLCCGFNIGGRCDLWQVPCPRCEIPEVGRCMIDGKHYAPDSICEYQKGGD